jgi:protein-L-isoaspartate O-methyltransferase
MMTAATGQPTNNQWRDAAGKLAARVTASAPEWHAAVSATPRHVLVPRWWQPIPNSYPFAWELVEAAWSAAYADETLVTRVGPLHADHAEARDRPSGAPTSSSTLPGLIVSMLHLLDPQEGDRVLDAGTGSGYSAALLAHRLGNDRVTSVDVDDYLVQAARERLAGFGRAPRIEVADATGPLPAADYDRILATVSVRPVPGSWLDALRPGGRIVTTIAQTSLLLAADMGTDGVARGAVQADPASFMRTRRDTDYPPQLDDVYAAARDTAGDEARRLTRPMPDLWADWPLRYLFELDSPDIENRDATLPDGTEVCWLLGADGSWARAEQAVGASTGTVHQSGRRRLWDDLERVQARWDQAGRFALHELRVQLAPDHGALTSPDGTWTLTL